MAMPSCGDSFSVNIIVFFVTQELYATQLYISYVLAFNTNELQ